MARRLLHFFSRARNARDVKMKTRFDPDFRSHDFRHYDSSVMSSLTLFFTMVLAILALFFARSAHGGGSVSRYEFLAQIRNEEVREFVETQFRLADEGRALRAGRHLPNAGERVAPFEIEAFPVGATRPVIVRIGGPEEAVEVVPCEESTHYSDCKYR